LKLENDSFFYQLTRIAKKNVYNIPEPVDGISTFKKIEVVFVPLLAYDKKGNRVGYGKGFTKFYQIVMLM
jgi:5-formyltetrahydrofolate cyclo-ligase